jgi:hypothetical protein
VTLSAGQGGSVAEFNALPGRNRYEKAMELLRRKLPGADRWSFDQLHEEAGKFLAQHPALSGN